jgi:hypothetical protein
MMFPGEMPNYLRLFFVIISGARAHEMRGTSQPDLRPSADARFMTSVGNFVRLSFLVRTVLRAVNANPGGVPSKGNGSLLSRNP